MNISLRKAKVIQDSIQEILNLIEQDIEITISLNEFEEVPIVLQEANDKLFENDNRRQRLLLALYNIRGLVGTANTGCGIDTNLAKVAFINKRIAQLQPFATAKPIQSIDILEAKLTKIRDRKEERVWGREDVTTSALSAEQIKQAKDEIQNLKKQKQTLNDQILEMNIKTEIPLSDDVVETLTKEGIL